MGIPLLRGRSFTAQDDSRGRPVMVVDEELAHTVFSNEDPIGKRIHIGAFGQDYRSSASLAMSNTTASLPTIPRECDRSSTCRTCSCTM